MKNFALLTLLFGSILLTSCYEEDPGPRQSDTRAYAVVDFDRVEAGDALNVTILQGSSFSIEASGDRRNLDDLMVYKNGNSLVLRFNHYERRQYTTSITITMPELNGCNFSGAVNSKVNGFKNIALFDLSLSGASLAQMEIEAAELKFLLSGASQLRLTGNGDIIDGNISGASLFSAFEFPASQANLLISGASNGKVSVTQKLEVDASGGSLVIYRGNPQLVVDATGDSVVKAE